MLLKRMLLLMLLSFVCFSQTAPTNVTANYFRDVGGSTSYSYWVVAKYPFGNSTTSTPAATVSSAPAALSGRDFVNITWDAMSSATSYDVLRTATAVAPTGACNCAVATGVTGNSRTDSGAALLTYTLPTSGVGGAGNVTESNLQASSAIGLGVLRVAHAKYSFAVDGGVVGAITLASTATIPDNALLVGAILNSSTACTSGGSATIAVGTTAGSAANSIITATAVASWSADALLNGTVTFAAPVKMTAAGNINITVATAALTAGVVEIFVFYVVSPT